MSENKFDELEIERYERIRLFEISKLKKEIEELNIELTKEKSKLFNSSKVTKLSEDIKNKELKLLKLEHQTGYDLLVESKESTVLKAIKNLDSKKVGTAIETIGKVIPVPGVSGVIKSIGKGLKKIQYKLE